MVRLTKNAKLLVQQNDMDWRLSAEDMLPEATNVFLPAVNFERLLQTQGATMQARILQLSVGAMSVGVGFLPDQRKGLKQASRRVSSVDFQQFADIATAKKGLDSVRAFQATLPSLPALPDVLGFFEGAASFCSGIPVVAALKIIGRGVSALRRLRRQARKYGTEAERVYPPQAYDRELDRLVAQGEVVRMLAAQDRPAGADLTQMFSPPAMGESCYTSNRDTYAKQAFLTRAIEGGGQEIHRVTSRCLDGIGTPYYWGDQGYFGSLPGGQLHQALYFDDAQQIDLGPALLPACSVLASSSWAKIAGTEAGPSLYAIAADAVKGRWTNYIGTLRVYLFESDRLSPARRDLLLRQYSEREWFGWSPSASTAGINADKLHPVRAMEKLSQRQSSGLDTLLCAYASEYSPAISQSSSLKAKMRNSRAKLLAHPARCRVDLDSVMDLEYRLALQETRKGPRVCAPGTLSVAKTDNKIEQTGAGSQSNGLDDEPKPRKSTSILPTLGLIALAAGGYALARKK